MLSAFLNFGCLGAAWQWPERVEFLLSVWRGHTPGPMECCYWNWPLNIGCSPPTQDKTGDLSSFVMLEVSGALVNAFIVIFWVTSVWYQYISPLPESLRQLFRVLFLSAVTTMAAENEEPLSDAEKVAISTICVILQILILFRSGWLQTSYCMLLPASSTRCSFWHNWTVSEISSNGYPGVQRCPGFTQQRCSVERRGILCFLPVQQGPADPSEGKSQLSREHLS